MKKLLSLILILLPLELFAVELKVGDVLLQPLNCWSCSLIEAQERSIYSHMGMVIQTEPEVLVIEALTTVRALTLKEFNARTEKGQKLSVRRLKDRNTVDYLQDNKHDFRAYFKQHFEGLKYDHDFIWDNYDDRGNEKFYCSEMVTKLLHRYLGIQVQLKIMKFDINREAWIQYFRGNPPDGKVGNSPNTFEVSDLFYEVGEL